MRWIPDSVGWAATAVFAISYFVKGSAKIRKVQACAALAWVCYGVLIRSFPVIAANVIVVALALYTSRRQSTTKPAD